MLIQEVRRGADRAGIHSLAFSENMQWLAVSSDKGTIHVFNLKINLGVTANDKPRPAPDPIVPATGSSFSFIKGVFPNISILNGLWHNFDCMKVLSTLLLLDTRRILLLYWEWMEGVVMRNSSSASFLCFPDHPRRNYSARRLLKAQPFELFVAASSSPTVSAPSPFPSVASSSSWPSLAHAFTARLTYLVPASPAAASASASSCRCARAGLVDIRPAG